MYTTQYTKALNFLFDRFTKIPLLVYGGTGIGKSDIPRQVALSLQRRHEATMQLPTDNQIRINASEKGSIGYVEANLTGSEYSDLIGLPVIVVRMKDGKLMLPKPGEAFEGTPVMSYAPPAWLQEAEMSPRGVMLFEEVNRMELQTRHAYMQILDTRRIGTVRIPDGWLIVQTANPADDGYQVSDFDRALIRRSCVTMLEGDLREWQTYGMTGFESKVKAGEHVHPRVLAISTRLTNQGLFEKVQNEIKVRPTYYGLVIASELMQAGITDLDKETRFTLMAGIIGADAANMLETALSDDKLKRLMEMFRNKEPMKGQSQDVMCDVMFLAVDEVRKDPEKFGEHLQLLWQNLPQDVKPVLAQTCYPWMLQHSGYRAWKREWREWCQENWDYIMEKGVDPNKTGGDK